MNGRVEPLINGHRYSFTSIELQIGAQDDSVSQTLEFIGFTSINYAEKVSQTAIYGNGPARLGRTVGPRTITADIQMYRYEWMALRDHIGSPLGRRKLIIIVQYADKDQPVSTDRIEGWLSEIDSSAQEGTEPLLVKLSFEPFDIKWGGLSLEEPGADGTFWLNDQEGIEGKDYQDNPWDVVSIGGVRFPGVSTIKGLPTLSYDAKKGGGIDGGTVTVSGHMPGPIDVECRIWTPSQWEIFQREVLPQIWRKPDKDTPTKKRTASVENDLLKTIAYPALTPYGITTVVVVGVSVPETTEPGVKVVRVKCIHNVVPKPKNRTKTGRRNASDVPDAKEFRDDPKNSAGASPGKTDTSLTGPATSKKRGTS